jgi:putative hydrolase of the HAD superfamily
VGAPVEVRQALCPPASERWHLFPGAESLLQTIQALGWRCALLSNGVVRTSSDYWQDFAGFGLAAYLDAIISSVDLGVRKPAPPIFEAVCSALQLPAAGCVMIGNSERSDIAPALALGMWTIRVAIEEPAPSDSAAHAVVTSLAAAQRVLAELAERSAR